ncbi:hypothetical protein GCM10010495_54770 [Kitasatospora herbaricolor]|uniref:DUF4396 domain-containing protein n=1 Tax=Kitasatospora herbaricolor TaxID=68217 RepID=UPI0017494CE5|nr:DUF4396 domain-containing protein [Kitasatospora herbaricolor]MDQ0307215.1 hypothetical protein [Kitasatospora herbaricolor]GGV31279.1 hypothetical protein GCM10010495_54770 [Kitasatospora herbaricolor]
MADPAQHAAGTQGADGTRHAHGDGGDHGGHGSHGGHDAHGAHVHHRGHAGRAGHGPAGDAGWRTAVQATLHCLTGCAIGEVLGMILGTALGLPGGATVVLSIALAFGFGYALTMRGVLKAGLPVRRAVKVALAADTVSILVMELIDNTVMVTVPGAMDAGLGNALFWAALAGSLALAFVLTVPVNRWMIARGRGHAVVHAHHQH